jgi:putative flippase GtrA
MDLRLLSRQFGSFGLIGAVALFVDTALLYGAMGLLGMDGYSGRALSWLGAATFTWYLNRRFTFGSAPGVPMALQWLRFLAANSVGGLINYGVYAALVATSPTVREWLVLGVAAGSLSGLVANFFLSRRFVFSRSKPDRFSPDS